MGEEGTGNLAGIRHALDHAPQPVAAVITIEGNYLGRVVITGVGSVRWRVSYHPEEWIETAPVADGLGVLAETIRLFREGQQ